MNRAVASQKLGGIKPATGDDVDLERALALLGPLESKLMRWVWTGAEDQPFLVRQAYSLTPELAYTTVMTTLTRLAKKCLLAVERSHRPRGHLYSVAKTPRQFLLEVGNQQAEQMVQRLGDAALVAFAAQLARLNADQAQKLQELGPL